MTPLASLFDAAGNPVTPDQRPPDVTDLPFYTKKLRGIPRDVEVRYLGGNWYWRGPEIVFWCPSDELQVSYPESEPKSRLHALACLRDARAYQRAGGKIAA